MCNIAKLRTVSAIIVAVSFSNVSIAAQYSIESRVNVSAVSYDNLFISSTAPVEVFKLSVSPQLRAKVSEANWESSFGAVAYGNYYSDHDLDNKDLKLDMKSSYSRDNDLFTISAGYDKDTNLNSSSPDFAVTSQFAKTTTWNVAPQYQIALTSVMRISFGLNHIETEYKSTQTSGFVPYKADVATSTLLFAASERATNNLSIEYTDYLSSDKAFEYQLLSGKYGIGYQLSEIWSVDVSLGRTYRTSTNRQTQTINFFGQTIQLLEEIDSTTHGTVLDAELDRKFENGSFDFVISRSDTTNSFGGLNVVDAAKIDYKYKPAELWSYNVRLSLEDIEAVTAGVRTTDREIIRFYTSVSYNYARNWNYTVSYEFVQREFTNSSAGNVPQSNRVLFGLSYIFPDISTY